ncbi:hypothetical protein ACN9MU_00030 [Pseudoduganella sp. R-32]|uniref:hypothetical protein n=1 Tax=Pseudoduganella sp. R-32 TaxID=3404061 RepID=UPI003CF03FA7
MKVLDSPLSSDEDFTLTSDSPPEFEITADVFQKMTGEDLQSTVDISRWKKGIEALCDYNKIEAEVAAAESTSAEVRRAIREMIFPALREVKSNLKDAGVWKLSVEDIEQTQRDVLMNGLVEGCDGNVHLFNTMALQIVQIAVVGVSYRAQEESWAHRVFKRDIRITPEADIVEETLKLLKLRSPDEDNNKQRKITSMMTRGVMTYMERQILATALRAPWRIGHGHPLPYELLTGSGSHDLIRLSIPVLQSLLDHRKFIFVPSDTNELHYKTIGDALEPREYAIIDDLSEYVGRLKRGGYRGEWRTVLEDGLERFMDDAAQQIVVGAYRASEFSPPQLFYSHRDFVHEAARIVIADSSYLDHRGFPMLIEVADNMCRTYFGAQSIERPALAAFGATDAPFRHLAERATRV